MNSNIQDLRRHLPQKVPKGPRFKKSRRPAEEANLIAQTSWISSLSPTRDSPPINNDIPIALPTIETMPSPLSRLLDFPNPTTNDENASSHSLTLRESFAAEAQLIKRKLITNLISVNDDMIDLNFMIDSANAAFTSLKAFHFNFGHLYDAVKLFIYCHYELLEAKKYLKQNGCIHHMLHHKADLARRASEIAKSQKNVKTSLTKASNNVTTISKWVDEARAVLSELENKLAQDNEKVSALRIESDEVVKSYEKVKSEFQEVTKIIEEKKLIEVQINSRRYQTKVSIDNIRSTLSTFYWNDMDN